MARPTEAKIEKWSMYPLGKVRVEVPADLADRESMVRDAIAEFDVELKNAIATEQALRALSAHADANKSEHHPLLRDAPNFWRVVGYGLFSSSVSTVGRIFDANGHGLKWYLAVCRSCTDVFSRQAIIARFNGRPGDLPGHVAPDGKYFEALYEATKPCWEYFHNHFLPMRNQWIGHRVLATSESASRLADTFNDADLDKFFGRLALLGRALDSCFRGRTLPVEVLDETPSFNLIMHQEVDQLFSSTREC
jgi:hypothetical protein